MNCRIFYEEKYLQLRRVHYRHLEVDLILVTRLTPLAMDLLQNLVQEKMKKWRHCVLWLNKVLFHEDKNGLEKPVSF